MSRCISILGFTYTCTICQNCWTESFFFLLETSDYTKRNDYNQNLDSSFMSEQTSLL